MKPQSITGALPTEHLLLSMEDLTTQDDCKLDLGRCMSFLLQLSLSLGACGLVHWMMT